MQALADAVRGAVLLASIGCALRIVVGVCTETSEVILIGVVAGGVGGLFGVGVGVAVGAARATTAGRRWTIVARPLDRAGANLEDPPPGLSRLDLLLSAAHGCAVAGLILGVLLLVCGGPQPVRQLAEFGHVAPQGAAHSLITLIGSLLVSATLVLLVRCSQRAPLRRLEPRHVQRATASGFFCGLVWPMLLLVLCAG